MAWPSIAIPSKINESIVKVAHRSDSEAGYVHTRAKWTGYKKIFSLGWNVMTSADKSSLESAFDSDQGSTFSWTHPLTSTVHTVLYSDDKIEFKSISKNLWSATVNLEEQQ